MMRNSMSSSAALFCSQHDVGRRGDNEEAKGQEEEKHEQQQQQVPQQQEEEEEQEDNYGGDEEDDEEDYYSQDSDFVNGGDDDDDDGSSTSPLPKVITKKDKKGEEQDMFINDTSGIAFHAAATPHAAGGEETKGTSIKKNQKNTNSEFAFSTTTTSTLVVNNQYQQQNDGNSKLKQQEGKWEEEHGRKYSTEGEEDEEESSVVILQPPMKKNNEINKKGGFDHGNNVTASEMIKNKKDSRKEKQDHNIHQHTAGNAGAMSPSSSSSSSSSVSLNRLFNSCSSTATATTPSVVIRKCPTVRHKRSTNRAPFDEINHSFGKANTLKGRNSGNTVGGQGGGGGGGGLIVGSRIRCKKTFNPSRLEALAQPIRRPQQLYDEDLPPPPPPHEQSSRSTKKIVRWGEFVKRQELMENARKMKVNRKKMEMEYEANVNKRKCINCKTVQSFSEAMDGRNSCQCGSQYVLPKFDLRRLENRIFESLRKKQEAANSIHDERLSALKQSKKSQHQRWLMEKVALKTSGKDFLKRMQDDLQRRKNHMVKMHEEKNSDEDVTLSNLHHR